jgi:hypothetical protein
MQVSRTRLLAAGAATGLAGVLTLTAAQVSSATSATSAPAVASPGKTAAAAGTPGDVAAKRAAAAREQRGSGGSPGDVAAKRAAAAREQRGSGGSPGDVAAKRAAAAREQRGPGSDNLLQRPETPSSLARSLGVSVAAVRAALRTLVPLSEARDGLDVASRGFVAAAAQLGVSPAQLARAIAVLKAAG